MPNPTAVETLQRALDHAGAYSFTADILIDALSEEGFVILSKEELDEKEEAAFQQGGWSGF